MAIEKNVNVVISATDKFSGPMTSLGGGWKLIAGSAIAAEAAILGASVAAAKFAVDLGIEVVDSAVDFHDAIYDVEAVAASFGTTSADISEILDDLVNRFPVVGKEAGEAMELVAQLGFGAKEELAELSETALNLSIATGIDMRDAVNLLGVTMNAFGLEVDDSTRLLNLFAAAQFTSAAAVSDLNEGISYLAPTMSLNNQTVETSVALFAELKNYGLDASQAATTIRRAFVQLYKETEAGTEVLKRYGLTYADVNPSTQDFADIIDKLDDQIFTAKDATDLFGVRAQVMGKIIESGADAFRAYRDSITDTSLGIEAVETKMAKFQVVMDNLGGSLDIMKKTFGVDLVSAITDFVGTNENEGIRLAITKIQDLELQNKQISGILLETFGNLREYAGDTFTELFPTWEDFYDYIVKIAGALAKNLEILGQFAIEGIAAFIELTNNTDNLRVGLGAVEVAFSALAIPIAAIHDLAAIGIGLFRNVFEAIISGAGWAEEKFYELQLTIQTVLSKLPFSDITDTELENLRKKLEEVKEANKDAFDFQWPDLWTDNVVRAIGEGAGSVLGFGDTYKSVMYSASDDTKALAKATEDWSGWVDSSTMSAKEDYMEVNRSVRDYENTLRSSNAELRTSEDRAKKLAEAIEASTYEMTIFGRETGNALDPIVKITNEMEKHSGIIDDTISREDALVASTKLNEQGVLQIGYGLEKVRSDVALNNEGMLVWADSGKEVKSVTEQIGTDISKMSNEEVKIFTAKFQADLKMTELQTKQTHELVKANLEWQAKLDIAQLEADAKKAVAAFETIGASVQATAEATASMFTSLVGGIENIDWYQYQELVGLIERQLTVQESLADAQIRLTNEQAEYMRLQNERLKRGEPAMQVQVTVEGDTEGWLAGLMESLFNEIFVKAKAEGFNVLAQG